jgi:hypothetical protein
LVIGTEYKKYVGIGRYAHMRAKFR